MGEPPFWPEHSTKRGGMYTHGAERWGMRNAYKRWNVSFVWEESRRVGNRCCCSWRAACPAQDRTRARMEMDAGTDVGCMLTNTGSTWSFALKQPTLTMLPTLLYRKCGADSTSLQEVVDESNRACQASLAANWMASSTRYSISLPWKVKCSRILMRELLEEENNSQRA